MSSNYCKVFNIAIGVRMLSRVDPGVFKFFVFEQLDKLLEVLYTVWPGSINGTPAMYCVCGTHGPEVYLALMRVWCDCLKIHLGKPINTSEIAANDAQLLIVMSQAHNCLA